MSELTDGLAKQFIDFMTNPSPAGLDTLLRILPVVVKDQKERQSAEIILKAHLRAHQNRCFDQTVLSPRHIQ